MLLQHNTCYLIIIMKHKLNQIIGLFCSKNIRNLLYQTEIRKRKTIFLQNMTHEESKRSSSNEIPRIKAAIFCEHIWRFSISHNWHKIRLILELTNVYDFSWYIQQNGHWTAAQTVSIKKTTNVIMVIILRKTPAVIL